MAAPTYNTVPQTPTTPTYMQYGSSEKKDHPLSVVPQSPGYTGENGGSGIEDQSPIIPMLSKQDKKLKHRIRYLRLLSRLAGTGIALTTLSQEGQTIHSFLSTQDTMRGGRGPWAKQTEIWSSVMMFALSLITALLGFGIIIAYFFSIKAANTIAGIQGGIGMTVDIMHLAIWIALAIAYRVAKNGKDLWGWACSPIAQNIQPNFEGIVNFKNVCDRGQKTWVLSIANAVVNAIAVGILILVFKRTKTKKEIKRLTMELPPRTV
ncbi:hypothetical protein ONS95_011416 [Cadophora gregata]|uniref:uncharacterized protein n=1 Tax=Cadophora gregata TaxID=51156 RepID=UPI0026DC892B|nr:uncharacterized protein ONS95_011416 [Cadophora gregata]KAK0119995.1 hypothetical protein ONS95_011416 [Cadophora gregata]KAK0121032.1 hypothetical protein ONS96_011220 [Cadophora gregata f. sp. sojae]